MENAITRYNKECLARELRQITVLKIIAQEHQGKFQVVRSIYLVRRIIKQQKSAVKEWKTKCFCRELVSSIMMNNHENGGEQCHDLTGCRNESVKQWYGNYQLQIIQYINHQDRN